MNKPSNHTTENKSARPFNARALTEGARNPPAPAGKEQNWIQTVPGKGWNTQLRLCGPLEPWFNKTWRPKKSNRTPDRSGKPIAMPEKIGSRLKASCAKMRELGISPSFLIGHVRWWGKAFRDRILGPERSLLRSLRIGIERGLAHIASLRLERYAALATALCRGCRHSHHERRRRRIFC